MNNQSNSRTLGGLSPRTLVNFPFLTTDSLTSLCDALDLKMGLPELRFCQNYFRNRRLANPTVDELKIIDRVFYDHSKRTDAYLIASFMTNDKTVADTYADLMARRRSVDPEYTAPCSVQEILNILPTYIKGMETDIPDVTLFSGKDRVLEAVAHRHRKAISSGDRASDAVIGVKIKDIRTDQPVAGDALYAVLKSFNNFEDFEKKLEAFATSAEVASAAKQVSVVDGTSIITALSDVSTGVRLNTLSYEAISANGFPFEHLTDTERGIIVTASKESAADMLIAAQEIGLRVILLGTLDNSKKIEAVSAIGNRISLDMGLLRALTFSHPIECEADGERIETIFFDSSLYIGISGERYKLSSATCGGKNAFMAGFNSVLYAYSLAAASGATDVIGAGVYTLPLEAPDKKTLGVSLELILGAYRAECELGICDKAPHIEYGDSPSLCFHTLSMPKYNIPSKISGKQSYIFYLEPIYHENGLPDFDDLKKMYTYIGKLMGDGIVLSICPTGEDLIATLDKMSADTCVEYIRRDELPAHIGGFIIETTQKIQGAFIAKTAVQAVEPTPENAEFAL